MPAFVIVLIPHRVQVYFCHISYLGYSACDRQAAMLTGEWMLQKYGFFVLCFAVGSNPERLTLKP